MNPFITISKPRFVITIRWKELTTITLGLESCDTCEIQVSKFMDMVSERLLHLLSYPQVLNHIDSVVKFSLKVPYSSISGSWLDIPGGWNTSMNYLDVNIMMDIFLEQSIILDSHRSP